MNEQLMELEKTIRDLRYELDRLKHEVTILKINSDSHERRLDIQMKTNDTLFEHIQKRQLI